MVRAEIAGRLVSTTLGGVLAISAILIATIDTPANAAAVRVSPANQDHFFGYYDKSPWDASGRRLLTQRAAFADRQPAPEDSLVIGVVDLQSGNEWTPVCTTRAWCWQQGCMLQWMPRRDADTPWWYSGSAIIYNDRVDDGDSSYFVAIVREVDAIRDVKTTRADTLPRPIYALRPDGRQALSVNFSRIGRLRPGYGYEGVPDPSIDDPAPQDDGIWTVDLATGRDSLLISIAELATWNRSPTMQDAEHWVNHLQYNPSGERFLFLHRWTVGGKWYTRMLTMRPDGTELRKVVGDGLVSHFDWRDDDHILTWADDGGSAYWLYTVPTEMKRRIGAGALTQDGHCSYGPDPRWLLTDTYPGSDRKQTLILFDTQTGARHDVGRYLEPTAYTGPYRCDLHPRWSPDGTQICFDSTHEGYRGVYVVDVQDIVDAPLAVTSESRTAPACVTVSPNPFNAEVGIRVEPPAAGRITLSVHSLTGQCVKVLVDGRATESVTSYTWGGLDSRGKPVASGVYLVRLEWSAESPRDSETNQRGATTNRREAAVRRATLVR